MFTYLFFVLVGILAILKVRLKLPANIVGVGRKDTIISSNKHGGIFPPSRKNLTVSYS